MRIARRLRIGSNQIPAICYVGAVVCFLLLVYGLQARRLNNAREKEIRENLGLRSGLVGLTQYEIALKYKVEELEAEVARRREQVEDLDHRLGLRTLRAENCEGLNQALYNRDTEQAAAIRACWGDRQWSGYIDRERITRRGP